MTMTLTDEEIQWVKDQYAKQAAALSAAELTGKVRLTTQAQTALIEQRKKDIAAGKPGAKLPTTDELLAAAATALA
jgi:hypothetical protein